MLEGVGAGIEQTCPKISEECSRSHAAGGRVVLRVRNGGSVMGMEYRASLPSLMAGFDDQMLLERLRSAPEWVLVSRKPGEFSLAYSDGQHRADWPEDITVRVAPGEVYVLFHAGTGSQRTRFLAWLRDLWAARGVDADFEGL